MILRDLFLFCKQIIITCVAYIEFLAINDHAIKFNRVNIIVIWFVTMSSRDWLLKMLGKRVRIAEFLLSYCSSVTFFSNVYDGLKFVLICFIVTILYFYYSIVVLLWHRRERWEDADIWWRVREKESMKSWLKRSTTLEMFWLCNRLPHTSNFRAIT